MKNKFTMELVWHNCKTNPPKEYKNTALYLSNGQFVHRVVYSKYFGWFDTILGTIIPEERLSDYYWADISQTVLGEKQFNG